MTYLAYSSTRLSCGVSDAASASSSILENGGLKHFATSRGASLMLSHSLCLYGLSVYGFHAITYQTDPNWKNPAHPWRKSLFSRWPYSLTRKCLAVIAEFHAVPFIPGGVEAISKVSRVAMPISVTRLWLCSKASMSTLTNTTQPSWGYGAGLSVENFCEPGSFAMASLTASS